MKPATQVESVVNTPNIVALNRVRTTFQRISDARFFTGWIIHVFPDRMAAYTKTTCPLQPGDEFSFQVFGNKQDAFFRARLIAAERVDFGLPVPGAGCDKDGLELVCALTTKVRFKASKEQPRFVVDGIIADLTNSEGYKAEAISVMDIGAGGFGAFTERRFQKGDEVAVTLFSNGVRIQCVAEVRNCLVCRSSPDYQRTGFQIVGMDRVNSLRWKQFYVATVEQNRTTWAIEPSEESSRPKSKQRKVA